MRYLLAIILLVTTTDCSKERTDNGDVVESIFQYHIEFSPSFVQPCSIELSKIGDLGQIKLTIFEHVDTTLTISTQDSVALTGSDFSSFFESLGNIELMKMKSSEIQGFDGIVVRNIVFKDSIKNEFSFWSPDKESREHKIVEAFMKLLRRSFKSTTDIEYFELLEQYFHFGLPCRVTSKEPLEIRIYGNLSSNESEELTTFIELLPSDRPILVDMTNFKGMGTVLYYRFNSLIRRNNQVIWVIKDDRQLREFGVEKNKIVGDLALGREIIRKNYSR